MHFPSTYLSVAALATTISTASATYLKTGHCTPNLTQPYYPPTIDCTEYKAPVTITSDNSIFGVQHWKDDYELEDFLAIANTRSGANYPGAMTTTKKEKATYEIAASFCTPKKHGGGMEKTIILATNGIRQAITHWNSPYKPEYNLVQWAISKGYSVFLYDRLGCGEYQKSYATHTAIVGKPSIVDAVILTAIGFNSTGINGNCLVYSFVPRIASAQNRSVLAPSTLVTSPV